MSAISSGVKQARSGCRIAAHRIPVSGSIRVESVGYSISSASGRTRGRLEGWTISGARPPGMLSLSTRPIRA